MSGGPSVVGSGSSSRVLEPGVPSPSGHCQTMYDAGVPAYEPMMVPVSDSECVEGSPFPHSRSFSRKVSFLKIDVVSEGVDQGV